LVAMVVMWAVLRNAGSIPIKAEARLKVAVDGKPARVSRRTGSTIEASDEPLCEMKKLHGRL
jgi:hypothetical protein